MWLVICLIHIKCFRHLWLDINITELLIIELVSMCTIGKSLINNIEIVSPLLIWIFSSSTISEIIRKTKYWNLARRCKFLLVLKCELLQYICLLLVFVMCVWFFLVSWYLKEQEPLEIISQGRFLQNSSVKLCFRKN